MNKIRNVLVQTWRSLVELMTTQRVYRWTAIASAVLVLLTAALPTWRIAPIAAEKPFIPLHYNIYLGVDSFGPWYSIFILPALGASLLIVNVLF